MRSARDLAARSILSEKTANAPLRRLRTEGLIVKVNGFWQRTEVLQDDVARRRGTLGHGKRQRERHAWERQAFRDRIESDPYWWFSKRALHAQRLCQNVSTSPRVDTDRQNPDWRDLPNAEPPCPARQEELEHDGASHFPEEQISNDYADGAYSQVQHS